jgi:hypothetical protein
MDRSFAPDPISGTSPGGLGSLPQMSWDDIGALIKSALDPRNNPIALYTNMVKKQYDKSAGFQKEAEGVIDTQIRDLGDWYNREKGTSFMNTESVQSALETLRKQLAETFKTQGNQGAAMGATNETVLAGRTKAQQGYSDSINKLAGYQTDRKDQLSRDYQYRLGQWLTNRMQMKQGQANQTSQLAGNMVQAPFDIAGNLLANPQILSMFGI